MDEVTTNVGNYLTSRGISLKLISRVLDIPYASVLSMFTDNGRTRYLRAIELLELCAFLHIDPYIFIQDKSRLEELGKI